MRSSSTNEPQAEAGRRDRFFFQHFLLFAALFFCIFQFHINKIYGFIIYPDEFGYWACAGKLLGYDWSGALSLGYYYSFGYSLILTPVLWLFQDGVAAYRAAVAVNVLLQCGAVGLLWGIYKKLYVPEPLHSAEDTNDKKKQIAVAVGIATFYPAWSFYAQTTMVEALMAFLYVLICYALLAVLEKPNIARTILLILLLCYLYCVHMRTVGVMVAAILTLICYAWRTPAYRKRLLAGMAVLLIGIFGGMWIKYVVQNTVYAVSDTSRINVTDYSGQLVRLKMVLTAGGPGKLFRSAVGKLYYLGMASFGLLYPAIYFISRQVWKLLRSPRDHFEQSGRDKNGYLYFFLSLSLLGQFMISAISIVEPNRIDLIVYGRYNEYLLPVFMGIGALVFAETRHPMKMFLINIGISTVLFAITLYTAMHSGLDLMKGFMSPGISYLSNDWDYDIKPEFVKAFLFGVLLMGILAGCLWIGRRFGKHVYALGAILIMEVLLTFCLGRKYTQLFNNVNEYDLRVCEYIADDGQTVTYLYDGGIPYISLLQFAMRDRKIEVITPESAEDILSVEGYIIAAPGCGYIEDMSERYRKCFESKDFILFQTE